MSMSDFFFNLYKISQQQTRSHLPAAAATAANASETLSQVGSTIASASARQPAVTRMQSPTNNPSRMTAVSGQRWDGMRASIEAHSMRMLDEQANKPHRYGIYCTSQGASARPNHQFQPKVLHSPQVNALFGSAFDKGVSTIVKNGMSNVDHHLDKTALVDASLHQQGFGTMDAEQKIQVLKTLEKCLLAPMAENGAKPGPAQGVSSLTYTVFTQLAHHNMSFSSVIDLVDAMHDLRRHLGDDSVLPSRRDAEKALWPNIDHDVQLNFVEFEHALMEASDLLVDAKSPEDHEAITTLRTELAQIRGLNGPR